MAKAKRFYQKEYSKHVGATVMVVASLCALALMACGVPLGVLMVRNPPANSRPCNTLWGYKDNCWNAAYSWRVEEETCNDRRVRWEAAEAFSVVSLFSLLFNVGSAWSVVGGDDMKTATTLIALFSIATTTVPWAIVAAFYHSHYCGEYIFTRYNRRYGAGFILMVTSFSVQCVGLILFLALEPDHPSKASKSDEAGLLKDDKNKRGATPPSSSPSSSSSPNSDEERE